MSSRAVILAALFLAAPAVLAAPLPDGAEETVKDRAGFIPQRKHIPLPGKVVGVLVADVRAIMGHDGRSGPHDAFGFSRSGASYRWVYVPAKDTTIINGLRVRVGEKGEEVKVYPKLNMAGPKTVKQWDVAVPSAILVEVEVNDGLGAPPDESFVGTKMKVVEGTKAYPLKVGEVLTKSKERYQAWQKGKEKAIESALAKAQKEALKDRKPTGPREASELLYLTWVPETERLRVHFRTRITDGEYRTGVGAAIDGGPAARPPVVDGVRYGTAFGVEFGVAYEVSKGGTVERALVLPIETFTLVIPPPPAARFPIDPLPPVKK